MGMIGERYRYQKEHGKLIGARLGESEFLKRMGELEIREGGEGSQWGVDGGGEIVGDEDEEEDVVYADEDSDRVVTGGEFGSGSGGWLKKSNRATGFGEMKGFIDLTEDLDDLDLV